MEGNEDETVCIELLGETELVVAVQLSTSSGSAIQGTYINLIVKCWDLTHCYDLGMDFDRLQAVMLVFSPATQMEPQCADIPINDDNTLEDTETFTVSLATAAGERVNLDTPSTVSIQDNDG